jgi:hypothetical protein
VGDRGWVGIASNHYLPSCQSLRRLISGRKVGKGVAVKQ